MNKALIPLVAVLALGGCATEAQINAQLARHLGESETDLVREMGVPTRHLDSGGHRFLAYVEGYQEIYPPPDAGWGYPGWGGGWGGGGFGGWGWGGWAGPWGGWAGPSDVVSYGCETTFEIVGGRVASFARHGNGC